MMSVIAIEATIEDGQIRLPNHLNLPEQVAENLNAPSYYPTWVERWGEIASPLLWSHAKYIILCSKKSTRFE